MIIHRWRIAAAGIGLAALILAGSAQAQQNPPPAEKPAAAPEATPPSPPTSEAREPAKPEGATQARRHRGPPPIGLGLLDRLCDPRSERFLESYMQGVEESVAPNDAQRDSFNNLKAAITKARENVQESCAGDLPITPTAKLELLEKRLEAMLQAIGTVRAALDNFYGLLNDEQKARFALMTPQSHRGMQELRELWRHSRSR